MVTPRKDNTELHKLSSGVLTELASHATGDTSVMSNGQQVKAI